MARHFLGRDEDVNEEGPSNIRPLPKKPRTSIYIHRRAAASTSNSGGRAGASNSRSPEYARSPEYSRSPEDSRSPEYARPRSPEYARARSLSRSPDYARARSPVYSDDPDLLSERELRQEEPSIVDDEEGSEDEPYLASDRSEEDYGEEEPISTANGNSSDSETAGPGGDALAPISVTLTDPDVLDCPICLEPLSSPVYQCDNGHIACESCCTKMRNKCGSCCLPIGYNRCRAIEKILESVRISCKNTKHGCKESLNYSKKLDHEKTCNYAPCHCPHPGCTYVSSSNRLYAHFDARHSTSPEQFLFDYDFSISLDKDEKHVFLQEEDVRTVFVLNRSIEHHGSHVNVICIAPTSSEKGYYYDLAVRDGASSIKLSSVAENTPQWTAQAPAKKYVLVPNDFITSSGRLRLEITIWRD